MYIESVATTSISSRVQNIYTLSVCVYRLHAHKMQQVGQHTVASQRRRVHRSESVFKECMECEKKLKQQRL